MNIIPNGTKVRYHGSLIEYHGEMTVITSHKEFTDSGGVYSPIRYYLRYGPGFDDYLGNVRPESFTVLNLDKSVTGFEGNEDVE